MDMTNYRNTKSLLAFLAAVALFVFASTAFADELNRLSQYREPIRDFSRTTTTTGSGVVAVVFPRSDAAQVVFLRNGKVKAGSAEFEFPMEANYGAAWVEQIKVQSQTAFTLDVRARGTCGPGVYNYSFSRIEGVWRLASLERKETKCSETDNTIVQDWEKRYDYLKGRIMSTTFKNDHPGRPVIKRKQFPVFTLAKFVPFSEVYEELAYHGTPPP
jgi:hypothetical protein